MNYFAGTSSQDMKDKYRQLAGKLHPDRGGSTAAFQEMKRQYEYWETKGVIWEAPKASNKPKNTYSRPGAMRCTRSGYVIFTPKIVKRNYFEIEDEEGNTFGFEPSWWKQNDSLRKITDSNANTYVHIKGVFQVMGDMKANIEFPVEGWENTYNAIVSNDGIDIGVIPVPTGMLKKYRCNKAVTISLDVPVHHISMMIRPDIKWKFEKGAVNVTVVIPPLKYKVVDKTGLRATIAKIFYKIGDFFINY